MPGHGQSFSWGVPDMNGSTSRGWGLRAKTANNRGRSNGRGTGQGWEPSPHNSTNGNGSGRGFLVKGFPPFGRHTHAVNKIPHVVEEELNCGHPLSLRGRVGASDSVFHSSSPKQTSGRGQTSTQALESSSPDQFLGRGGPLGHPIRPPLWRTLGRGWSQVPDPASSAGNQDRNVPFREDIVESVIRTTVSVANGHPLVPPPFEMANGNESQPSSHETLPRVRISVRNGMEEPLLWNPTRCRGRYSKECSLGPNASVNVSKQKGVWDPRSSKKWSRQNNGCLNWPLLFNLARGPSLNRARAKPLISSVLLVL